MLFRSEGLTHIKTLTELQELNLGRTKVTDAGLAQLEGMSKLVELTLDSTEVGDLGLARIEGLNRITTLSLDRTKVTDDGVARLQLMRADQQAQQAAAVKAGIQPAQATIPALDIVR